MCRFTFEVKNLVELSAGGGEFPTSRVRCSASYKIRGQDLTARQFGGAASEDFAILTTGLIPPFLASRQIENFG